MGSEYNQLLKNRLRRAGLRTSLPRLKVLDALRQATQERGGASARALHAELVGAGLPISLAGVRQVICRLSSQGVIAHEAKNRYTFSLETGEPGPATPQ